MSKSTVEIDFFQMEKQNASFRPPSPDRHGPPPLRGIQSLVSRINPQLLKAVMASGAAARHADNVASSPNGARPFLSSNPPSPTGVAGVTSPALLSPLPALSPAAPRSASRSAFEMAPLTIFYNGTVAAFDVPRDKAEAIIKMAETGVSRVTGNPAARPEEASVDGGNLEGDMPIMRKKSLQRFLEKRKERLASASPYGEGVSHAC